jgi:hypothetical protein
MVRNEEKEEAITEEEEEYIFSKETDEVFKKGAEQLADIIKDPQRVERIQKIIEVELSGEIGELTRSKLMEGISAAVGDDDAMYLIIMSTEMLDIVDLLPVLDISEDVLAFLKELNLLYGRKAEWAYNYSQRKNDWVNSKFEVDATDEGLKIGMYLAKGSGEIVHIAGSPFSFLNILGSIVVTLNGLELTEVVSEEEVNEFEKDVNTLINKLKGKESKGSG